MCLSWRLRAHVKRCIETKGDTNHWIVDYCTTGEFYLQQYVYSHNFIQIVKVTVLALAPLWGMYVCLYETKYCQWFNKKQWNLRLFRTFGKRLYHNIRWRKVWISYRDYVREFQEHNIHLATKKTNCSILDLTTTTTNNSN